MISATQDMIDKHTGYMPTNNMRELIRDNNLILMAISRFDIAFGFGDNSVKDVCVRNNVDVDTFLTVCNLLSGYDYDVNLISLPSLMGYLRRAHVSFLDLELPKIRYRIIEAINYSDTDEVSLLLIRFFDDYTAEVKRHMDYENDTIFRYVEKLLDGKLDEEFSIDDFSGNHGHTVTKLNELKDIFIYHYNQKDSMRLSAALYDIINCEKDMMSHFEVEKNLFVPAVEQLEKQVRSSISSDEKLQKEEPSGQNGEEFALGDREKDIIRCVAQGKSNKEIADELFISPHTVATHRRNISAKLGIHSAAGLTIFAILHKLVNLEDVNPHQ